MKFFNYLVIIALLFTACKKEEVQIQPEENISVTDSLKLTKKDISLVNYKDIGLDVNTNPIISNWQAYLNIVNGVEKIKTPDFTFFNADVDLFNSSVKDFEETIPEDINTEPVRARVLVLKTMLYKFQEIESLQTSTKQEKLLAIQQVFVALSNLNLQINKKIEKDNQTIIKPY
ncbi:hypothetical protein [Olleya sp. YS]|uniref:hypothetical protein n=1 Tax=Olleya sp. YS TaxID=3028318 RepID=UPI0024341A70|nr:hypothetical protein [Olleya sp. YS]WGD35659.1 hypothetical protein Ollyesu_04430 [Olleya sp. YS]